MTSMKQKIDFAVGGQAVIEGVMMRSPHFYAISVRDPEGKIQVKHAPFESITARVKVFNLPLIRGVVQFVENMKVSFGALDYSSAVSLGEEEAGDLVWWQKILSIVSVLISLGFTIFLMKAAPLWIAGKAAEFWPLVEERYFLFNLIDGFMKMVLFFGYVLLISLMKDIRRTYQYHGAEHKSVWAYEKGLELTVANARKQTRFHPRCGTSFMFLVILMSVFIYTLFPPLDSFWFMLASRIAVVPLIAGVSYEVLRGSYKWPKNWVLKALTLPGLFFQKLTTSEPDDEQLEVALNSLKLSLELEKSLQ